MHVLVYLNYAQGPCVGIIFKRPAGTKLEIAASPAHSRPAQTCRISPMRRGLGARWQVKRRHHNESKRSGDERRRGADRLVERDRDVWKGCTEVGIAKMIAMVNATLHAGACSTADYGTSEPWCHTMWPGGATSTLSRCLVRCPCRGAL